MAELEHDFIDDGPDRPDPRYVWSLPEKAGFVGATVLDGVSVAGPLGDLNPMDPDAAEALAAALNAAARNVRDRRERLAALVDCHVQVYWHAGHNDRFAPGMFDRDIGSVVPMVRSTVSWGVVGLLVSAEVADDGADALLTFAFPELAR